MMPSDNLELRPTPAPQENEPVLEREAGAGVEGASGGAPQAQRRRPQYEVLPIVDPRRQQRKLVLLLSVLLVLLACVVGLFVRYLFQPAPLPDLLPVDVAYAPHYLFSIYGVDKPVGVAISSQGDRLYVAESGGERLVRAFDRAGNAVGSLAPPRTGPGERAPVYLATDSAGRVLVTDRLQHAVLVYDREGTYLDSILGPDLTLSEYVAGHAAGLGPDSTFAYNRFEPDVYYGPPGGSLQTLAAPGPTGWSPLGLRIDRTGQILLTDILASGHVVREIPAAFVAATSWRDFDPPELILGGAGQDGDPLRFPNSAVSDSQGRTYVTDGNNGRIAVWDNQGRFLVSFGQGTGEGALSLPRGAAIDRRDRLYVADAVGQEVMVYDVSGPSPAFLFAFGQAGLGDGQFNYPNDVALDASGRVYVADRENGRVQVWSY